MDSAICTVQDSPLPNKLNEIKRTSDINIVVSISYVKLLLYNSFERNCREIPLPYWYYVGAL